MPVSSQETAKFPSELKEIQISKPSSDVDVLEASDSAQAQLQGSLGESRLQELRKSTSEIETQVSQMNKEVPRMASASEKSTDV